MTRFVEVSYPGVGTAVVPDTALAVLPAEWTYERDVVPGSLPEPVDYVTTAQLRAALLASPGREGGGSAGEDGADGASVVAAGLVEGHLLLTLSTGATLDAGPLPGISSAAVVTGNLVVRTFAGADVNLGRVVGADGQDGRDGRDGQDGAAGKAATVTIGNVSTVAASAVSAVRNVGTTQDAVLDLDLPRGVPGEVGATPEFTIGTVTTGTTASATITGTAAKPVLNLVLVKGEGTKGDAGTTPEFSIGTVTTGTTASATITGTAAKPVLNLVLVKGDKGDAASTTNPDSLSARFSSGGLTAGGTSTARLNLTPGVWVLRYLVGFQCTASTGGDFTLGCVFPDGVAVWGRHVWRIVNNVNGGGVNSFGFTAASKTGTAATAFKTMSYTATTVGSFDCVLTTVVTTGGTVDVTVSTGAASNNAILLDGGMVTAVRVAA